MVLAHSFSIVLGRNTVRLWTGYTKPRQPDKIMPDGARWKSCWFCLASWTRSLQETWRKLARLCQTASEFYFVYNKSQNLVVSGSIWPASFNFPSNFWSRKPDRTSNFFIWLRLAWFCLAVWAWCSQSIIALRWQLYFSEVTVISKS